MRVSTLLVGIVATVLSQSVFAQEELIEDMHVVKSCAREVRRLCPGVEPGEGRIKACITEKLADIKPECVESVLGAVVASRKAPTLKLNPGPIAGLQVHLPQSAAYAYCEIAPIIGAPDNLAAQFYNTSGTTGPAGGCPQKKFAAINATALSEKDAAAVTYMNPTPQTARRHWVDAHDRQQGLRDAVLCHRGRQVIDLVHALGSGRQIKTSLWMEV